MEVNISTSSSETLVILRIPAFEELVYDFQSRNLGSIVQGVKFKSQN